ncbi:MAG: U32 family peptidase [Defluviitaleaceae bacterium]|nr:U32 family peptidase [Defluviitaleaceae bacterium]
MKKTELLAPAGSMKTLKAAVKAGADAVYLGAGKFSARANAANFHGDELITAIDYAKAADVKVYLAINTLMTDRELKEAMTIVEQAYNAGIAAFILQDLGLAYMVMQKYPDAVLHASTQMTAQTLKDVTTLGSLGFKRVVMARELSRVQIKEVAQNTTVELEIFIHGALCSSYSGQCLMSSFLGGRSANRGNCAQPCRLPYKGRVGKGVLLSLKDLCLIDHVGDLAEIGVKSLKIEGRMKGEDYVCAVVGAYRQALDGKILSSKEKKAMLCVFDRGGYTDGYYSDNKYGMYMDSLRNPYRKGAQHAD